jgi:hypothetical protein
MNQKQTESKLGNDEEKPPVFGTWNNVYTLVFLNLVILIIFFYIFTKVFE